MGRLFLPGQVVSAENQGTFSDYHSIYNWSGTRSPAYVFNGAWLGSNQVGMYASDLFSYGNGSTSDEYLGSRLSKN